jgi:hypothetical protein
MLSRNLIKFSKTTQFFSRDDRPVGQELPSNVIFVIPVQISVMTQKQRSSIPSFFIQTIFVHVQNAIANNCPLTYNWT